MPPGSGNMNRLRRSGYGSLLPNLVFSAAFRRVLMPAFRYNPFTAADEKIPLSMVRVNPKPQYLVFCLHSPHLAPKHRPFACGKRAFPYPARVSGLHFAPIPVQIAARRPSPVTRLQAPSTSVALPGSRFKAQERCSLPAKLWRCGHLAALFSGLEARFHRDHLLVQNAQDA